MKKCNWCGEMLSKGLFYKHPSTADRLQSNCKSCQKELARKHYRQAVGRAPRAYKRKEA